MNICPEHNVESLKCVGMEHTAQPSGRCAAREALERLVEHIELNGGCHRGCEEHDVARAALASPCCVTATDQEQVKEALEKAPIFMPYTEEMIWRVKYGNAALALLGSNEEEEPDGRR